MLCHADMLIHCKGVQGNGLKIILYFKAERIDYLATLVTYLQWTEDFFFNEGRVSYIKLILQTYLNIFYK